MVENDNNTNIVKGIPIVGASGKRNPTNVVSPLRQELDGTREEGVTTSSA